MRSALRIGIAAMNFGLPGYSGGVDIYTRQLVEALANYDSINEYYVFLYDYSLSAWTNRRWPTNVKLVTLQRLVPRPTFFARVVRRLKNILGMATMVPTSEDYLARQLEDVGLDLLHFPATIISPLSVKVPCLLGFWDMQHEYYPQFFTASQLKDRELTYKPSVDKAVYLIASSHHTHHTLIEKYGVSESRLSIVPPGIFDSYCASSIQDVSNLRAKYNLQSDYIFYPANPWPHKNHARLMAALRIYRQKFGEPPLLVVSGRLHDEVRDIQSLAIAAGVEDRVIDLGFVPGEELRALYSGATMLVFPSLFEGFGIPLLEAMACGCPIAAADSTAIPECVGDAALLFDPFDVHSIANAIHELMVDEQLRNELRLKGLQRVQNYHWQKVAPKIVEVYQAAVARRS